jgi:phenylpropionate dioxygenase-like ring-hydroxylating dioxygenase large terminal subunit
MTPGLPNRAYTDADWFARERTELFRKSWTAIASRAQVAQPGDLLSV